MTQILLIEDDHAILTGIVDVLGFEGYAALVAMDGLTGIEMANEHLPDLILCDIRMPGATGYEVQTALQNNPKTADIPFVFMTAKMNEAKQEHTDDAAEVLSKPFTIDELIDLIERKLRP